MAAARPIPEVPPVTRATFPWNSFMVDLSFLCWSEAWGGSHYFGEIFPANVWVTIFPFRTMKVSVPSSKRLSAVSAFHTM
jgi:hypothetical protein